MRTMKQHYIREQIAYTGEQLAPHWIMRTTGIIGDAIAAFQGPADVPLDNMVDLADVRENAPIRSNLMLHFLIEHFGISLENAALRQRLFMAVLLDELRKDLAGDALHRRGDDLFDGERKLSVSIASASPVSCCIHAALNVDSAGTPVPAVGLADYGIDPGRLARNAMNVYVHEHTAVGMACSKVKPLSF